MKLNWRNALLAVLLVVASAARAEDVTFRVPVDVKSLEAPIKMVAVYCRLFSAESPPQQISAGYSPFVALDAAGNYSGTLSVKLSGATAGQTPNYRCSLTLAYANQAIYRNDLILSPATDDFGRPQPGTPYIPVVGITVANPGGTGSSASGGSTSQCAGGYARLSNGQCATSCVASSECAVGYGCANNQCLPQNMGGATGQVGGTASGAATPPCPGGYARSANGQCASSCTASSQCTAGLNCMNSQCVDLSTSMNRSCTTSAECAVGFACANNQCVAGASGSYCTASAQCAVGLTCSNNQCVASPAAPVPGGAGASGSSCTTSAQCAAGLTCANNQCVTQKGLGAACARGSDCLSGACRSGRCVAAAARSCAPGQLPGAGGTCQACPANSNCTCPAGMKADGLGGCTAAAGKL